MMNNFVFLRGKVQPSSIARYTYTTNSYVKCFLNVPRLSGTSDIVPVTFYKETLEMANQTLEPGKEIAVCGSFRSYRKNEHNIFTVLVNNFVLNSSDENANQVQLTGVLKNKATVRTTPLGSQIADVTLSVPTETGTKAIIPCIFWGYNAHVAETLNPGDLISLTGRFQSREYQKRFSDLQEPILRRAYEVSVSHIVKTELQHSANLFFTNRE